MTHPIAEQILTWYKNNARELPWRLISDPYAIWVSEIMLQQTRVETVIPYYLAWLERFPTIADLAKADQQEVLSQWEGLGYYARARNMHRCAQEIITKHNGQFPDTYEVLLKLPGIGPYTAAAVCSFAFGQDHPAIDANLKRVFSRLFCIEEPVNDPKHHQVFYDSAMEILPGGRTSPFNQGLMDLGATICLPKNPNCSICPLNNHCEAHLNNSTAEYPKRKASKEKPHIIVTAAIIREHGRILITQRPEGGLLGGLWEFPGGKQEDGESLQECLQREIREELGVEINVGSFFGKYKHAYTHFHVTLHAFDCTITNGKIIKLEVQDTAWINKEKLLEYPMGKIDRSISKDILKN